jgi:hypothetical protein
VGLGAPLSSGAGDESDLMTYRRGSLLNGLEQGLTFESLSDILNSAELREV